MKYVVGPWACLAFGIIFGGILIHAIPTLEVHTTPKYEARSTVGKLNGDRYAAVARMYEANGIKPEDSVVAVETVVTPASEATVSHNVMDEARPSSGNKKTKLRSEMINNDENERKEATMFKELPFEKNRTITFKIPLEETVPSAPSTSDDEYSPVDEVPLGSSVVETLTDDSDKPKVVGVTFKKGVVKRPVEAPPALTLSPLPNASTSEILVNEETVPSAPSTSDDEYSPVDEVPLGSSVVETLTDDSDKPKVVGMAFKKGVVKRPVEATAAAPNDRSRLAASEVPVKNPDPVNEEVTVDYNVKRRPTYPILTVVPTAPEALSNEDVANGYVVCNKNANCGDVPKPVSDCSTVHKKKRVYNASNMNLRSLPDTAVEPDSPVHTLPVDPPYANKDVYLLSAVSSPSSKDSRFPNGEPIYDVLPFGAVPREVNPPPSTTNEAFDWFRNEKPSPFKYPNRAGPEVALERIVSAPDTRKPSSMRTDNFTEKFTEGVEQASHGISTGLKTFGSCASKKAKATKDGIIKVRRTTGKALAKLCARVTPKRSKYTLR